MNTPRIIALANQKGGVGKTTTSVNLGAALGRHHGKRVLLIDLDPQGHASRHLGIDAGTSSIWHVLKEGAPITEVIRQTGGIDLAPAGIDLAGADLDLGGVVGREALLRKAIAGIRSRYDYILIDCPPSLGLLTLNALASAGEVLVCLQAQYFALAGMGQLRQAVQLVHDRLDHPVRISGVIVTLYDARKTLCKDVLQQIRAEFGELVFHTPIRDTVALAEAPITGVSIFDYQPKSYGAEDYAALAQEVMSRE